jgi:two-component system alkaline phosphatase synthesis response regulator PhoP
VERILVIDDDPGVQRALRRTLEPAGYDIVIAADGYIAMDVFRATLPRLVVLDLRLPGKSGQDLCREIRGQSTTVPILVLSAASEETEKVLLLELGADDYITKPFSPREFLARVHAAIRRLENASRERGVFRFDAVEVDIPRMQVRRKNTTMRLTLQECKLLRVLLNRPNCVVPLAELLAEVWDDPIHYSSHAISLHVFYLRQKLENDPTNPAHLMNVHGVGYKFLL